MNLTNEIANQLKEQFNPEGSQLRKAQLRMLDMLLWVDSVMKKNDVPYALTAGTLLGAVRHGGFIPWDDDIDLIVPKQHYERMKKAFLAESHPQYVLQCTETDPADFKSWVTVRDLNSKYVHTDSKNAVCERIMKYTGFQIDLFPIDNHISKNVNRIITWWNWGQQFYYRLHSKSLSITIFKIQDCLCRFLQRVTPKHALWSYGYGVTRTRYEYKEEDIFPFTTVMFEGHEFPAPHNIDAFLKAHFGDYMDVPDPSTFNKHAIGEYRMW